MPDSCYGVGTNFDIHISIKVVGGIFVIKAIDNKVISFSHRIVAYGVLTVDDCNNRVVHPNHCLFGILEFDRKCGGGNACGSRCVVFFNKISHNKGPFGLVCFGAVVRRVDPYVVS
ncbi:hypothetical protein [Candidatus Terasakiella magnetica]|uniref:hypothetical protein n=1 Tax=Candidatus Terasakiella magnetica TaxID=1867952 RepID=UPI000840E8EC|nr:hypothetical protein [Candidatus Terasakiella magnetica]